MKPGYVESAKAGDAMAQVATAVPQMPSLTPGAAGTLNFQAQSPETSIQLMDAIQQREVAQQKASIEQQRWGIQHAQEVSDYNRFAGGQDLVKMPASIAPGMQGLQGPLQTWVETVNRHGKTTLDRDKAFELAGKELAANPRYQATVARDKAQREKIAEIAASNLPASLREEKRKADDAIDQEVKKRTALLPVTQKEIEQKNAGYSKDRDDELAHTLKEADEKAKIQSKYRLAAQKEMEQFRADHRGLTEANVDAIRKDALRQLESQGWNDLRISADPEAHARETRAMMESIARSNGAVREKFSGTGPKNARERRSGGGW